MKFKTVFLLNTLLLANNVYAGAPTNSGVPKRIQVYAISQNFWDVTPGETLGEIVKQLLPDNPSLRNTLLHEIVKLNPDAFSHNTPDQLKANVRLWLPNNAATIRNSVDKNKYNIQSFSWGQLYTPKR